MSVSKAYSTKTLNRRPEPENKRIVHHESVALFDHVSSESFALLQNRTPPRTTVSSKCPRENRNRTTRTPISLPAKPDALSRTWLTISHPTQSRILILITDLPAAVAITRGRAGRYRSEEIGSLDGRDTQRCALGVDVLGR
jgi:hypothetical protein